ncbi:hypothetical protein B296_00049791 [Ensete ventricosum]|uniref:Uncharacterized protein n=1 Tax=Ensete ventricosum TaxID=4639 RepID=A0A426XYR5_ENSVE|nr:hypothetical protein B296_00049791 [Ensete ventricosum]
MLRPSVTREWVGEGELPKKITQSGVTEALRYASRGHTWRDRSSSMIRAIGELDYFNAYIRFREPDKSEDKAEGLSYPKAKRRLERKWARRSATVPRRRIYRSRRKGRRCKVTDSRAMGWQRHVLIMKGAEEVENAETNSTQDKAEGQRPRNFIRPVSTGISSR